MSIHAPFGRRFAALCIDWWIIALPISALIAPGASSSDYAVNVGVFGFEVALMTYLAGASFGQLPLKLRVVDIHTGKKPRLVQVLIRTAGICLVLPAIITKEGRGLHDVFAGTEVVKLISA